MVVNVRMSPVTDVDPRTLDLATLATLAADSASDFLLAKVRATHPALRPSHGYIFQHLLVRSPTVGELASSLGITQQAVSKSILELEALGYVERQPDPGDSRARRVALTAAGRSAIERGRAARAALEKELLREIGEAGLRGAKKALVALLSHTGGLRAVEARKAKPRKME